MLSPDNHSMQEPPYSEIAAQASDRGRQAPPAGLVVRVMTRGDLERVGEVLFRAFHDGAVKRGFAPKVDNAKEGTAWAWAIFRHAPHEILIAEVDGHAAGVCCLNPRGDQGGVGPVAVDPAYQGKGIGGRMVGALIERAAGLRSVRLFQEAFNPASFSLYYGLGFEPVADLLDLTAEPGGEIGALCGDVSAITVNELDEACAYDMQRSTYDRRADLAYYAKWGKVLVHRQASQIRGVLACLPAARSVHFGPLVAEGEEEALCLFRHALAIYGDRRCETRIMARDRALSGGLRELGFKIYSLNMLMVRGAWRPGRYTEAFGRFPEGA